MLGVRSTRARDPLSELLVRQRPVRVPSAEIGEMDKERRRAIRCLDEEAYAAVIRCDDLLRRIEIAPDILHKAQDSEFVFGKGPAELVSHVDKGRGRLTDRA